MQSITVSVTIPTLKTPQQVDPLLKEVLATVGPHVEVRASCLAQSAAKNRNWCIDNSVGQYIIQIDDDMTGFYMGWVEDLIQPLKVSPEKYSIVAPRLLTKNGALGPQLGAEAMEQIGLGLYKAIHTKASGLNVVCSACIAFERNSNVRFDADGYAACVWEDTDFCMQMNKTHPTKMIIINENCKLIHLGEAKGREAVGKNRQYFLNKWQVKM